MNIAMIHFRVGELDGVSLEMDKWRSVLEKKFNYEVTYLAGSLGRSEGYLIPELALDDEVNLRIRKNAFQKLSEFTEQSLKIEVQKQIKLIKHKILKFFNDYKIDYVIPNNMFSLPLNIPASIALVKAIKEKGLSGIVHNHDFYWERTIYNPTCTLIQNYLLKYFPPDIPKLKNAVINSIAQSELFKRRQIHSTVIPNVFYFEEMDWKRDSYNSDLRKKLGIDKNDLIFLQATRIVDRKGIELIIDLINELNEKNNRKLLENKLLFDKRHFGRTNRIILVMPNIIEDKAYKCKIQEKMDFLDVDYRFCNDLFAHSRYQDSTQKIYSLWDSYIESDIISYPSILEGWGNQFLEAIKSKTPIITFEYPVYKEDIKPLGFETVSLGSEIYKKDENGLISVSKDIIEKAAIQTIRFLQDSKERKRVVEKNYQIGLENLSLTALGNYLSPLLNS